MLSYARGHLDLRAFCAAATKGSKAQWNRSDRRSGDGCKVPMPKHSAAAIRPQTREKAGIREERGENRVHAVQFPGPAR